MNHASRRSGLLSRARSLAWITLVCCAVASYILTSNVGAQEASQMLTVPAIVSPSSSSSPDSDSQMNRMETSQPTLPDGKLPQYQLDLGPLETEGTLEEATLRFLLALPAEPILIEANITIDGQPFRQKREQRVQEALKAALNPDPETEVRVPTSNETAMTAPLRAEKPADAMTLPTYQSASSNIEKLKRYINSIGREPTLAEARWFFVNRLDGPTLLLLKDHFQAFRSDQTPIFHILDRNRDGVISGTEIGQAVESFRDCDLNRNDIVDYLEINEAASDPRLGGRDLTNTSPLLYLLPTDRNAAEVYGDLLSRYDMQAEPATSLPARFDPNSNGQWEAEELEQLRTMPADIILTVSFNSTAPNDSELSVSEKSFQQLAEQKIEADIVNNSIVLSRPDCDLWLSAIQLQAGDQISLGAVSDGYPMLPVLDPNEDGRFTIRELRGVTQAIRQFDVNEDGQIFKEELRSTIRVGFGLGASVHHNLAGVRTVRSADRPPTTGPDWFVRMDRNKDHDLTRQEFPGTDEQFTRLDADHDNLISADEALEYDRQNSPEETEDKTPQSTEADPDAVPVRESATNSDN